MILHAILIFSTGIWLQRYFFWNIYINFQITVLDFIVIFSSKLFIGFLLGNGNPCNIAKRLPSFELRLKVYKINPFTDTALCDRYLINDPGEWFRSEDGNEMVNNATEMYECGTEYGIYMLGKLLQGFLSLTVLRYF